MSEGVPAAVDVVVALIGREGRWFLQRRDPEGPVLPGLWEFPGGKVGAGETLEAALRRELEEEVGWRPERWEALPSSAHAYPGRTVVLHPFRCEGGGSPTTELAWGWFLAEEVPRLRIPAANAELLPLLGGPR
jgi:mutator protein MutT